jgi:glycosyltransferase involved in cell wall biosynthesis
MNKRIFHRQTVSPVSTEVKRPLWSVMIPTYNCADYLRETLASVLMQDLGKDVMQIVVVDNCSTKDDPEAVVRELGLDRVEFYRQPENVGSLKNFETCLDLSTGYLVHTLHSDDCVCPGFYSKMTKIFQENPDIGAAFCRSIYIDENGDSEGFSDLEMTESGILPINWIDKIVELCRISVPSLGVVRREVYETLGGWDQRCGLSGDWEMWVRIFMNYPIWFETEPLAMWRRHSQSNNATSAKSWQFIQDNFNTVEANLSYLHHRGFNYKLAKHVRQNSAFLALESAEALLRKGETRKALAFLLSGIEFSKSPRIIASAGKIIAQNGVHSFLRSVGSRDSF